MGALELKIDVRRRRILDLLDRDGKVIVSELASDLGATPATIRNDLNFLGRGGYLERVQGGAVPKNRLRPDERASMCTDEKRRIAEAAASMIRDRDTLFINSGTTTLEVARRLREKRSLNIVTNSFAIASELGAVPSFRVILLGGELNVQYAFTCGGDAQEQLRRYKADSAIISLDGVSADGGITTYHADEAIIDRMMIDRASRAIIVADHTKMGRAGFSLVCPLARASNIITDSACPENVVNDIRNAGVEVTLG